MNMVTGNNAFQRFSTVLPYECWALDDVRDEIPALAEVLAGGAVE